MKKILRLQSAMEYLMTYGWAILIIAVVLGALFQLGVFNSSSFSPRAPPGSCQVFRPNGPSSSQNINLIGVCTGQLPQYVMSQQGTGSIIVANSPSLNVQVATFSFWVKSSTAGWNNYLLKQVYNVDGYWVGTTSGSAPYFYLFNSGTIRAKYGSNSITDGNWHYVGITYNGVVLNYYVDGKNSYVYDFGSYLPIGAALVDLRIGYVANQWIGNLANIQIYNSSLSANEVQALYSEGLGGTPLVLQNLVGWWPLNGDTKDYSGNNNNGVPTSVTFTSQYGK